MSLPNPLPPLDRRVEKSTLNPLSAEALAQADPRTGANLKSAIQPLLTWGSARFCFWRVLKYDIPCRA
jgi:hypothetical protein